MNPTLAVTFSMTDFMCARLRLVGMVLLLSISLMLGFHWLPLQAQETAPSGQLTPLPDDNAEADDYRVKATAGDIEAARKLGLLYYNGKVVSKNFMEALKWLQKAANQGDSEAQCFIGVMYEKGEGVTKDYSQALKWFQKAANQGYAPAQYHAVSLYYNGHGVAKNEAQVQVWFKKAFPSLKKAADQGDSEAQSRTGLMYENGWGVAKDYSQAMSWFQKAANQGNAEAQCTIGVMYEKGEGVTKDFRQALSWFQKAADQGNAQAKSNIDVMLQNGWVELNHSCKSPDGQITVGEYLDSVWAIQHSRGVKLEAGEHDFLRTTYYPSSFRFTNDSQWLVRMQTWIDGESFLFLYHRTPQGLVEATHPSLDDAAWNYLQSFRDSQLIDPPRIHFRADLVGGVENNYKALGENWPNNRYIVVSLSGDTCYPRQHTSVSGWWCRYDLKKGTFDVPPDFADHNIKALAIPEAGPLADRLKSFVANHVAVEAARDFDAFVADYANRVDYFNDGILNPDQISIDKEEYFERWPKGNETVDGEIQLTKLSTISWAAKFKTNFHVDSGTGQLIDGQAIYNYRLQMFEGQPLIIAQKVQIVHEQKSTYTPTPTTTATTPPISTPPPFVLTPLAKKLVGHWQDDDSSRDFQEGRQIIKYSANGDLSEVDLFSNDAGTRLEHRKWLGCWRISGNTLTIYDKNDANSSDVYANVNVTKAEFSYDFEGHRCTLYRVKEYR